MFQKELTVKNRMGLHARPATQLVALCRKFESDIRMRVSGEVVNPKSIMNVLAAGITQGSVLILEIEGPDEDDAGKQIVEYIDSLEG